MCSLIETKKKVLFTLERGAMWTDSSLATLDFFCVHKPFSLMAFNGD